MKRLYILRHAKAAAQTQGDTDFNRPLATEGAQDADALGKIMVKKSYNPSLVLCSGALRTKQTYENMRLASQNVEYRDPLYEASAGGLLAAIHDIEDRHDSALLVGHNPAVHDLGLRLTSEDSGFSLVQRLIGSFKPGTLAVLDCPCHVWNDLQLGENMLVDLLEPLDYNAPDRPTRWM